MSETKSKKNDVKKTTGPKKDRVGEVANTFEYLITAFILAFVFRAFIMEAFRIPTGSMADTLKGAHFRLRCRQCGYNYEYGFVPGSYGMPEDTIPANNPQTPVTRCPSCGFYQTHGDMPVANGDRILVLKCIYQFLEPKRWDVVVFKNPTDPSVNYIKRLVALPDEQIQIIDGDIYINGQIARKPPKVQEELWMPVYDNDYQPVDPFQQSFNTHKWQQPFRHKGTSIWEINESEPTIFRLDSSPDDTGTIVYDTSIGNDFKVAYAYNSVSRYDQMPNCSDLMVRFYCRLESQLGHVGISLKKYQTEYRAWINFTGEMVISKEINGQATELARSKSTEVNKAEIVKFANVDHKLIFEYGGNKLTHDLGVEIGDAGIIDEDSEPQVEIFGSGKLALSHVAIFRDIHYTYANYANNSYGRATQENPLLLDEDEFFVLGDNSPNSEDGRLWREQGIPNKGLDSYRTGIVPRDYLVGKALFVYWPSGFKPFSGFRFNIIPNVGKMRLIYGGSNKEL